ncbi:hypothetical protein [Burkholderia sp. MSMB1459WGS]|uniref:hypothetical protein n=1 Tax=Burkholderia sp. MSMB1459WGS TaxID=1637970 RepID=UPI000A9BBF68|nr:hypothetical protein [Burkholderia sp. MSMB1459WGS]
MSTHSSDTSKDDAVTQANAEDSAGHVVMQQHQSIQAPTSADVDPPAEATAGGNWSGVGTSEQAPSPADAMASVPRGMAYQSTAHSTGAAMQQTQESNPDVARPGGVATIEDPPEYSATNPDTASKNDRSGASEVMPQESLRGGQLKWNEQRSDLALDSAEPGIPSAGDPINHDDPVGERVEKPDDLSPFGSGGVN